MTRQDLQALRIPLVVLALTLLAVVGFLYFSGKAHDAAKARLAAREHELKQARKRIRTALEAGDLISRYLASYQRLVAMGFVGEEQRMNWLDALRSTNDQARLFGVEYDIGVQRPHTYAAQLNVGPLLLQESVMQLRLRLLHEEDLLRFFDALANTGGGLYTIDECRLRRLKNVDTEQVAQPPNVAAECALRWLTAKPPLSPEKKP
ncbi:MAG TPA: hypothetical protein VFI62_14840 [Burkholderiales bacterium]|nr:hypothetical protein [Burkholderiales bacterium]